jgi:hypothetical protein
MDGVEELSDVYGNHEMPVKSGCSCGCKGTGEPCGCAQHLGGKVKRSKSKSKAKAKKPKSKTRSKSKPKKK